MNEQKQIEHLEREIESVSYIEDKLRRYIRREGPGEHRNVATEQLKMVTTRLDRAERELACLKGPKISKHATRRTVKFFGIEHLAQTVEA